MNCIKCGHDETFVRQTRRLEGSQVVRRRRVCSCGHRFNTYEIPEGIWVSVRNRSVDSHDKALQKQAALRKRNEEIVRRVKAGEKRWMLAEEFQLSKNMVSHITRKAGLPARSTFWKI